MTEGRRCCANSAGVAGFVLSLLALTSIASGAELRCRSDPSILFADGTVMDVYADISTDIWNVESVEYTIRVPVGLIPIAVVRTPNWPTTKEVFRLVSDRGPGRFEAVTVVRTASDDVDVTAQQLVVRLISAGFDSATGSDGDRLATSVFAP